MFQRAWSVVRSATERANKLRTEKYAFNTIFIWKLQLVFAKAMLLKVVEVVTCLHWGEERGRDEEIEKQMWITLRSFTVKERKMS